VGIHRLVPGGLPEDMSRLMLEALQNRIAIAACHTNFDRCAMEVVEAVSKGLGLAPKGRLVEKQKSALVKLVVFVPLSHVEQVREAMCVAGAGRIGNYDVCSFGTEGEGTFRGDASTDPFIGRPGSIERVKEVRLETILPRGLEKPVIAAMLQAHPYEEVAYDLYPVEQAPSGTGLVKGLGYGFWGEFPRSKSFSEVLRSVKSTFNVDALWVTEPVPSSVRRVAFAAGKGASAIEAAMAAGCDVFVTGEAGYHEGLGANRRGLCVMELGHRESEKFFLSTIRGWLVGEGFQAAEVKLPTQRIR
jgi:hypothetical protein